MLPQRWHQLAQPKAAYALCLAENGAALGTAQCCALPPPINKPFVSIKPDPPSELPQEDSQYLGPKGPNRKKTTLSACRRWLRTNSRHFRNW